MKTYAEWMEIYPNPCIWLRSLIEAVQSDAYRQAISDAAAVCESKHALATKHAHDCTNQHDRVWLLHRAGAYATAVEAIEDLTPDPEAKENA